MDLIGHDPDRWLPALATLAGRPGDRRGNRLVFDAGDRLQALPAAVSPRRDRSTQTARSRGARQWAGPATAPRRPGGRGFRADSEFLLMPPALGALSWPRGCGGRGRFCAMPPCAADGAAAYRRTGQDAPIPALHSRATGPICAGERLARASASPTRSGPEGSSRNEPRLGRCPASHLMPPSADSMDNPLKYRELLSRHPAGRAYPARRTRASALRMISTWKGMTAAR